MNVLKKYAYQSPETEILSLETKHIIMESPDGPPDPYTGDPGNPSGLYPAPWRY